MRVDILKIGYSGEGGERRSREKIPVPEPGSRIVRPFELEEGDEEMEEKEEGEDLIAE